MGDLTRGSRSRVFLVVGGSRRDVVQIVTEMRSVLEPESRALDCADAAASYVQSLFAGSSATVNLMDYELRLYHTITNVGELSVGEQHHPQGEYYSFDAFPATTQQLMRGAAYCASLLDLDCPPEHRAILESHGKDSCMGAPIRSNGRPLGEIWVTRMGGSPFTDNDVDLAVACGATLARHLVRLPPIFAG